MYENHTSTAGSEIKVLNIFLDLKRHYFAEITKVTGLTRPRVLRILRKFVQQDLLEIKSEANIKYYSLKKSPLVYAVLGAAEYRHTGIFLIKHKNLKRALDMLKEKYKDYLTLLVFGSIVKGYAVKDSDSDLLFIKEHFSESEIKKVEDIIDLINGRIGVKISPYFMKVDEFRTKNAFVQEAIEKHILIEGAEFFFRMVLE